MYSFLRCFVPPAAANALMIAWYVLLILLIIALSLAPQGEFRYGNI